MARFKDRETILAFVSGVEQPLSAPTVISLKCLNRREKSELCQDCSHGKDWNVHNITVNAESSEWLRLFYQPNNLLLGEIKKILNVPGRDCNVKYRESNRRYVTPVILIPQENPNSKIWGMVFDKQHFDPTTPYELSGIWQVYERGKQILIIDKVKRVKPKFEDFQLPAQTFKRLDTRLKGKIKDVMARRIEELEEATSVVYRRDMIRAMLLTMHSQLQIIFGHPLGRGTMDVLILGAPRTGKSAFAKRMVQYFDAGEIVSGEHATTPGLTVTIQQGKSGFFPIPGRFIRNHKTALIIDEAQGVFKEVFPNLSRMRSDGVLEVNKANTSLSWPVLCRTIWIANPKGSRKATPLNRKIPELIDTPEDIARFDLAIGVNKSDNQIIVPQTVSQPFKEEDQQLLRDVWGDQEPFTVTGKRIFDTVASLTKSLHYVGTKMTDVATPDSIHEKLLRIAIATTNMTFRDFKGKDAIDALEYAASVIEQQTTQCI